ncbi:acetylxylan esterase [Candidatus Saccharibacteria bacterium]|nr:acetylxylan esterase [Candidatus Saccharibacteria bacterium]
MSAGLFTGESGGEPRYVSSWDLNVEDYQTAVDFLSNQDNVDPEKISIIGICGWGGVALEAACIDTRIKATVSSPVSEYSLCYAWR